MADDADRIVEMIKRAGNLDALKPDQNFYDAGIDSMKALDVMLDMENEFGVTVPDERFVKARTATDLAALVAALRTG